MNSEYYFFNVDIGLKLTGVERSSFKRAILFSEYLDIVPKFVTVNLNLNLRRNWEHYKNIGWVPQQSQLVNIYEDIRKNNIVVEDIKIQELRFDGLDIKDISETHQRFYKKDKKFNMYVVWRDKNKEKIDYINYFSDGLKFRRDKFDFNGYLAVSEYLNENGKVDYEDIFNYEGIRCLTQEYNEKSKINKIYLYNQSGIVVDVFLNRSELVAYWCLNYLPPNIRCIVDKNRFWTKALSKIKYEKNIKIISVIHSMHLLEPYDNIYNKGLNYNYKDILNGMVEVDACLVLTPQQTKDIQTRFEPKYKLITIPHSNDFPISKIPFSNRKKNKLVALARLSSEKQLEDMIEAVSEVIKKIPNTELYIYGEGAERKRLEQKIIDHKLEKNVYLPGYIENIGKELNSAVLFLFTSKIEAFGLVLLESMSHGVPVISYDMKYGPSAIVKNHINGHLVEKNNSAKLAEMVCEILSDHNQLEKLSEGAYATADEFSMEYLSLRWKKEMDEL